MRRGQLRPGETILGRRRLLGIVAAVLVLAACPPPQERKPVVQPPLRDLSPTPLPLRAFTLLPPPVLPVVSDAADLQIKQVESVYQAGMDKYRAGNLEGAKEDFDQALTLMLSSGLDIQSDDRLSAEFSKLVEDIYSTELAVVERGDTLSPHIYEPAPIESFAGLTFPVDPKVKQLVQQELQSVQSDLPLISNDEVVGVLTYFQGRGHGFISRVLQKVGLYQSLMSQILREEGVPQDLIYLAAAESSFNPFALSSAGAKGIWQFMLGRGMEYGLKKDRWVDEREDPMKSTRAAARHLRDLYKMFGDWYLAIAAYNCGPVNVQKAIEKTGYVDFWTLRRIHALPRETENYVPIILATALIAKTPNAYGFDVQPDAPLGTDQTVVTAPTDLRLVAQLIDRPPEELIRLNPGLLRWTTPANDPQYTLHLPPGTKDAYEAVIAKVPPDKRLWWRAYKVGEGETLAGVAKKFHLSILALKEVNRVDQNDPMAVGTRLLLPLAPGKESTLARVPERGVRRAYQYNVRSGDTIELIADRFDVTPYEIRRWNRLTSSRLVPGTTLRLQTLVARGVRSTKQRPRRSTRAGSRVAAAAGHAPAHAPSPASRSKSASKKATFTSRAKR
jgi:membrane-bound lytic murein transglycosylase D